MVHIIARAFGVFAVVLAFGSNAVLAAPAQAQAQGNCISTLPGNFTLTALNTTLSNVNSTGIPLLAAGIQSDHSGRTYQLVVRHRVCWCPPVLNHLLMASQSTTDTRCMAIQ
jgi:hypothetical protein